MTNIYSASQIKGASPKQPHTVQEANAMAIKAFGCFEKVTKGNPEEQDVVYFCSIYNFVEQAIDSGLMSDPTGVIASAFESMSKAVLRFESGKAFRLDGNGINHAMTIIDAYIDMARELPRRDWMKNINRTHAATLKAIGQSA